MRYVVHIATGLPIIDGVRSSLMGTRGSRAEKPHRILEISESDLEYFDANFETEGWIVIFQGRFAVLNNMYAEHVGGGGWHTRNTFRRQQVITTCDRNKHCRSPYAFSTLVCSWLILPWIHH